MNYFLLDDPKFVILNSSTLILNLEHTVFFRKVLIISAYFLPQDTRGHCEDSCRPFYISKRIPGKVQKRETNVENRVHSASTRSGEETTSDP